MAAKKVENDHTWLKLSLDTVAAGTAGFAVTPFISAVDRALAENASGVRKLWPSFGNALKEMFRHPFKFVKSPQFFWIWLTYASTYLAANATETICARQKRSAAFPKWVSTSVVNTATCMAKDRAYARLFGVKAPTAVPMSSYAAWLTRDFVSMGVFFTLPPIVAKATAKYTGSERASYYVAQFCLPLALQFVTTPIHLLGYDCYNEPKHTMAQRLAFLRKDYLSNVGIRMLRMVAPWSVGTIGNREARQYLFNKFVPKSNPKV